MSNEDTIRHLRVEVDRLTTNNTELRAELATAIFANNLARQSDAALRAELATAKAEVAKLERELNEAKSQMFDWFKKLTDGAEFSAGLILERDALQQQLTAANNVAERLAESIRLFVYDKIPDSEAWNKFKSALAAHELVKDQP